MARKTTRATIIQNSQQNSTLGVAAPNSTERTLALSSGTCGGANTRPGKGKEYCHHSCSERSEKGQKLGGTSTMQLLPQLRGALLSERKSKSSQREDMATIRIFRTKNSNFWNSTLGIFF